MAQTSTWTFTNVPASTGVTIGISGGTNLTANDTISWNGGTPTQIPASNPSFTGTGTITAVITVQDGYFTSVNTSNTYFTSLQTDDETVSTNWGLGNNGSSAGLLSIGFASSGVTTLPTQIPQSVTTLGNCFKTTSYNGPEITSWNTNNVTDMNRMFQNNSAFNQNLAANIGFSGTGSWNTGNVVSMERMFQTATSFDQNIRYFNVTSVTNFGSMFVGATAMQSTYTGVAGFGDTPTAEFFNLIIPFPCFLEGSHIETDNGVVPVQNLRNGDLVKTFKDGFKPIVFIGTRVIRHTANPERVKDQLYICPKEEYPEASDDLVLTGCHSILVHRLFKDDHERNEVIRINGDTYVTDGHYRLPACVDDRTKVFPKKGTFNIYHFALENEDYYMNYGVYANNILVESSSKRYMKEESNMRIIE